MQAFRRCLFAKVIGPFHQPSYLNIVSMIEVIIQVIVLTDWTMGMGSYHPLNRCIRDLINLELFNLWDYKLRFDLRNSSQRGNQVTSTCHEDLAAIDRVLLWYNSFVLHLPLIVIWLVKDRALDDRLLFNWDQLYSLVGCLEISLLFVVENERVVQFTS